MEQWIDQLRAVFTDFGLRIVAAIAIFIIGRWAAGIVRNTVKRLLNRSNTDPTLVGFISNLAYIAVLAFIVAAALAKLGVQTASFVAMLGAAGLAIGLALQGSLSNFASGVLLLFLRPFKGGDYIEAAGTAGIVRDIQILTTTLMTPDNRRVVVPNSKIMGDTITNFSAEDTRRMDLVFGVGYDDNLEHVKSVIKDVLAQEERILSDPAPVIGVVELADSSINIAVRPWVKAADYWDVMFSLLETMKNRFDAEGINIPYPQRDIHVHESSS
ncbi:MAG: mechanosensitive ion channel domain-containing protein [Elainellaceae cyanobacterium]